MSGNDSKDYYEEYSSFMEKSFIGSVFSFSHVMMERRYRKKTFNKVLELGATNLNHVKYVRHTFENYLVTDLFRYSSFRDIPSLGNLKRLRDDGIFFDIANAEDLSHFADDSFDRLVATCLILHLQNYRKALLEWRRVTKKKGGVLTFYVHCEPGILLRFMRFFSTNLKKRKDKIDHLSFVYAEHGTYFLAVKHAIHEIFRNDKVSVSSFPFPFLSWNLNLWKIYHIELKDVE